MEIWGVTVSVEANVKSNLLLNARELQALGLVGCTGIQNLRIQAPKLFYFYVHSDCKINWQWFEGNQQLKNVNIILLQSTNQERSVNLEELFGYLSRVCTLSLKGFSLKSSVAPQASARLPTPAQNLTELSLSFPASDLDHISCCLCLLRSSPNLEKLKLYVDWMKINKLDESVIHCLEASESQKMKLEKLKAVKIECMVGHKAELLLVKLLLGCSKSLEKIIIQHFTGTDISKRYWVATEVSRFSRASPKAQVIFINPIEVNC